MLPCHPRHPRIVFAGLSLSALALGALAPPPVAGLPAYSRAGGPPCTSCHQGFSALKPAGMKFLEHGDRFVEWQGRSPGVPRGLEVSAVVELNGDASRSARAMLSAPPMPDDHWRTSGRTDIAVHAVGGLGSRAAWHVEARLPTRTDVLVARTAFVQVRDLIPCGRLDFKAGEFLVPGAYLALTRPARFASLLTEESLPARGVELHGEAGAWAYGAGLIHSRRRSAHVSAASRVLGRLEDTYVWLMRDLGGQRVGAKMLFDRQDSSLPALAWLQHLQAQGSGRFAAGRLQLVPAYAFDRFDDRPAAGLHQRRQTAMLEATLPLDRGGHWSATAFAEHDYTTRTVYSSEQDHHLEAVALAFAPRPGAEIALEWSDDANNAGGPQIDRLSAWLRLAF